MQPNTQQSTTLRIVLAAIAILLAVLFLILYLITQLSFDHFIAFLVTDYVIYYLLDRALTP